MSEPLINLEEIREILTDCFFKAEEVNEKKEPLYPYTTVEAIMTAVGLHTKRLNSHRNKIIEILNNLNPGFKEGMSFIEMCVDKEGNLWGEHSNCEELLILGMGIGCIEYCVPREAWGTLPGSLPYILINMEDTKVENI